MRAHHEHGGDPADGDSHQHPCTTLTARRSPGSPLGAPLHPHAPGAAAASSAGRTGARFWGHGTGCAGGTRGPGHAPGRGHALQEPPAGGQQCGVGELGGDTVGLNF